MVLTMMSFLIANLAPMFLSVSLIYALLSVLITAIILRKAVSMFNNRVISDDECVRMPSLLGAMGISLVTTIVAVIVAASVGSFCVFVSESMFRPSPEELRSGNLVLLMIPTVVVGLFAYMVIVFFAYIEVIRELMSVSYRTGMRIAFNDYIIRFVILLILDGIGFVLYGIGLIDGQILLASNFLIILVMLGLLDLLGPGLILCLAVKLLNTLADKEVVPKPPFFLAYGIMILLHVISALVVWGIVGTIIPWDSSHPDVRHQSDQFYLTVLLVVSTLFWVWSLILAKTLKTNLLSAMGVMFFTVILEFVLGGFLTLLFFKIAIQLIKIG